MADAEGTARQPGLDNVDLAVVIGISIFVGVIIIVAIVLCCCARRRRKGQIKRNDTETQKIRTRNGDGVYTISGIDNPNTEEIRESHTVVVTSEPSKNVDAIEEHQQKSEDLSELYASVNKPKKSTDVVEHVDNTDDHGPDHDADNTVILKTSTHEESLEQVSSQIDASRNSPDGAPDPSMKRSEEVTKNRTEREHRERHVSSTGTDVVSIDDDITKLQSNGQYMKVNHEISFSSTEDDHSSDVSKPSVVFGETRRNDDYDHLRLQTTARHQVAVERRIEHDESFYSSVSRQNSFIIPPDSTGIARVFVNSNNSNVRNSEKSRHRNPEPIATKIALDDEVFVGPSMESLSGIPEHRVVAQPSPRQIDTANQVFWTQRPHHHIHRGPAQEHQGRKYRVDLRDNISTYTDGGYTLSEYVVPPPRYQHYTSVSTLGSIGRDRSHSIDDSVYYVPSRRTSLGSGYSVVASTYDPRRHVHRRMVPDGRYKLHKPLSMFDLHKMKYRSYKGSLPPFNVPL